MKKEEKLKTFLNFLLSINSKSKVLFVAHFSAWLLKISLWYHWIQWWRYFQWLPQSSPDIPLNFKTSSFSSYCSKLKVMFSLWWFIFPVISATWFLFSYTAILEGFFFIINFNFLRLDVPGFMDTKIYYQKNNMFECWEIGQVIVIKELQNSISTVSRNNAVRKCDIDEVTKLIRGNYTYNLALNPYTPSKQTWFNKYKKENAWGYTAFGLKGALATTTATATRAAKKQ